MWSVVFSPRFDTETIQPHKSESKLIFQSKCDINAYWISLNRVRITYFAYANRSAAPLRRLQWPSQAINKLNDVFYKKYSTSVECTSMTVIRSQQSCDSLIYGILTYRNAFCLLRCLPYANDRWHHNVRYVRQTSII